MTDDEYIAQTGLSKKSLQVIDEFYKNMPPDIAQYIDIPIKVFGNLTHNTHNRLIKTKNGSYIISIIKGDDGNIYRIAISTHNDLNVRKNTLLYRYTGPTRWKAWPEVESNPKVESNDEAMQEIFGNATKEHLDQLGDLGGLMDL